MTTTHIRVIGDIHGHLTAKGRDYFKLISGVSFSVQLGDMSWHRGIHRSFYEMMSKVDPRCHRVVTGNHDPYDNLTPHHLGDFGNFTFPLREGNFDFFFIRGAYSIDRGTRLPGLTYWDCEELNWSQGDEALSLYVHLKPKIVFTHDCPEEVCYLLDLHTRGDYHPTITHRILQSCFEVNQPELWVFGHHHRNWKKEYKGTTFMCLDGKIPEQNHEVGYIDFDEDGKLITLEPV